MSSNTEHPEEPSVVSHEDPGHSAHDSHAPASSKGSAAPGHGKKPLSKTAKLLIGSSLLSLSGAGLAAFFLLKSPNHSSSSHEVPEVGAHGAAEHSDHHTREPAHSTEQAAHDSHTEHSNEAHAEGEHHGSEESSTHADAHHSDAQDAHGFMAKVSEWYHSILTKAEALRRAEEENEQLRVENANLRFKVESLRFDCHVRNAENQTRLFEQQLVSETGSKAGRMLASLSYRPPQHLQPGQLYTLAVSYFKAREDEKSAVILTMLTEMKDNAVYQLPKNFLMTGISWYRLKNYDLADLYFTRVLESVESSSNLPYQGQARLWKALVAHHLSKPVRAQFWLRELVDHHPRSLEASWVNRLAGGNLQRALASPENSRKLLDRVNKIKEEHGGDHH